MPTSAAKMLEYILDFLFWSVLWHLMSICLGWSFGKSKNKLVILVWTMPTFRIQFEFSLLVSRPLWVKEIYPNYSKDTNYDIYYWTMLFFSLHFWSHYHVFPMIVTYSSSVTFIDIYYINYNVTSNDICDIYYNVTSNDIYYIIMYSQWLSLIVHLLHPIDSLALSLSDCEYLFGIK